MKSKSKKDPQESSRKRRSRPVQKKRTATNNVSELEHRVETLERELAEAQVRYETSNTELCDSLEQQTATSEVLRVIANSPTNLQSVLDVVAENAARLCEAKDAAIFRVDGDVLQRAAICGPIPIRGTLPLSRGSVTGRAVVDRQTIHIHDMFKRQ